MNILSAARLYRLSQVLLWTILGAFSLYIFAGRALMLAVPHNKDYVLHLIAKSIGNEVRATSIATGWDGFSPWVRLRNFEIVTAQGIAAVQAGLIEFDVNPWRSLLSLTPVANAVHCSGVDVQIVQDAEGLVGLKGGTGAIDFDLEALLDFAFSARRISIKDSRVRLDSQLPALQDHPLDVQFHAHVSGNEARTFLQAQLVQLNSPKSATGHSMLTVTGRFQGELSEPGDLVGDFRFQAQAFDLAYWRAPLVVLNRRITAAADLVTANLQLQPDGQVRALLHVEAGRGQVSDMQDGALPFMLDAIDFSLQGGRANNDWHMQIVAQESHLGSEVLNDLVLAAKFELASDGMSRYRLHIPGVLDTEPLRLAVVNSGLLEGQLHRWLSEIRPRALVENIHVQLEQTSDRPLKMAIIADLQGIQVQKFNAIPFIDGAAGRLLATKSGGQFTIQSPSLSIAFPDIFTPIISVHEATGYVTFAADGKDSFFIQGSQINAKSTYGSVTGGGFSVRNPADPILRTLSLYLSLADIDCKKSMDLLPVRLAQDVQDWLRMAVQGGVIRQGGALYHGHLTPPGTAFELSSLAMLLDLERADLAYDPAWPPAEEASGRLFVTETDTRIFIDSAKVFDVDFANANIFVPGDLTLGNPIRIDGRASGELGQMFGFVRDTPAHVFVDQEVLAWELSGTGWFDVEVAIPIDRQQMHTARVGQEPIKRSTADATKAITTVVLNGRIADAELYIPTLDLTFAKGQGHLLIDSQLGVFSDALAFEAFDGPGHLSMRSDWTNPASEKIYIDLAGTGEARALAEWTGSSVLYIAEGQMQYRGDMEITLLPRAIVKTHLFSDLVGVRIPMPQPFTKAVNEARATEFMFESTGNDVTHIQFSIAPDIRGLLEITGGELSRGVLRVADDLPLVLSEVATGLRIIGKVDSTDLGDWIDYIDAIERIEKKYILAEGEQPSSTVSSAQVQGTLLHVGEFEVTDFSLDMIRVGRRRDVALDSEEIAGVFLIYDDDSLPIIAELDRVSLILEDELSTTAGQADVRADAASTATAGLTRTPPAVDPLFDVEFEDLVPMQVEIALLEVDGESYGSWSFDMRPSPQEVVFSGLSANIRGLLLNAQASPDSEVIWRRTDAGDTTSYKGVASSNNLSGVFESWGYTAALTTQSAQVEVELAWLGSPAMFDWLALQGSAVLQFEQGGLSQVSAGTSVITKIIGLLDVSFWLRRLSTGFSDLSSEGLGFDRLQGTIAFDNGQVQITDPVRMVGPGVTLAFSGRADIEKGTVDGDLIVTLPLSKNLPWMAAYLALFSNPLTGFLALLSQRIFRKGIDRLSSARYEVTGRLDDLRIKLDKVFSTALPDQQANNN